VKVYLAGPIAGCRDREVYEWRDRATGWLNRHGIETLDPSKRDYRNTPITPEAAAQIVTADLRDIDQCDVLYAHPWKPSHGTSMEILYAYGRNIPVVAAVPSLAQVSPWIRYHVQDLYLDQCAALNRVIHLCST
jgi:nucleoside 2-deoxyribosyltransferase